MIMKKSDILDRWTILLMKSRLDKNSSIELEDIEKEVSEIFSNVDILLVKSLVLLMESNAKIWVTESSIRQEYKNDLSCDLPPDLKEIGKRALFIRECNKVRMDAKKKISEIFKEIPDRKVGHVSE